MMTSISSAILLAATWPVLALLMKVTLVLAIGLVAARFAGRAATVHLILTTALAAAVLIPIVAVTVPPHVVEVTGIATTAEARTGVASSSAIVATRPDDVSFVAGEVVGDDMSVTPPASVRDTSSWPSLGLALLVVWLAGAAGLVTTLAIDLRRVRAVRREGLPDAALTGRLRHLARTAGLRDDVEVLVTEQVSGPLVTGLATPAILLPADASTWSDEGLLRAVAHEMEHVRRADWPLQVVARTICAVYWFHPLVWMTWSRLCLAAERACDDAVTRVADPASYAEQLVTLARRCQGPAVGATLGMAGRTNLSARVRALLDPRVRRGPAGWPATVATAIASIVVVSVVAPLRADRVTPAPSAPVEAEQIGGESITSLDRDLYEAALRGRIDAAGDLIARGGRVNASIPGDGSPLIGAVRSGRIDVVRLLLERGAQPNLAVPHDGSALIVAADLGHLDITTLLLDRGADPDLGVRFDGSPLIVAAGEGHADVVDLLLARGAHPAQPVQLDGNPLIAAARGGHLGIVRTLLDAGAPVDDIVPGDETALMGASHGGHLDVVRYLVERGADVNLRAWAEQGPDRPNGEWRTPLVMAERGRHPQVVEYLRSVGARE
jgi:beta-lactamase regulating signal transducer with metallopeptidase domain/ankyrin repeat protein